MKRPLVAAGNKVMTAKRKASVVIAALAIGAAASAGIANAHNAGHVLTRTEYSKVTVEDDIRIKEKGGSEVTVYSLKLDPGEHAPWHYHPGPHIVSVKTGPVRVYETDCSYREYPAGTGFYDPGVSKVGKQHVHTLWNPTSAEAEVVITDVRTDDRRLAVVVSDPPSSPCFQ